MAEIANAAAVAQILGLDEAQISALVATEVLPRPERGQLDPLACVRAYTQHMRDLVAQQTITWTEARRRYECEGANLSSLAPLIGVSKQRVHQRARNEGWIDKREAVAQATAEAIRRFVARDTEAVLANIAEKHTISRDLLAIIRKQTELAREDKANVRTCLALRHLSFALRTIEAIDSGLAGLREGDWRPRKPSGEKLPPLPTDFDFLEALTKSKTKQPQEIQ